MIRTRFALLVFVATLGVGLTTACAPPWEAPAPTPTTGPVTDVALVTYTVPNGRAEEIAAVLSRVLGGDTPTGRASVGPSGEVVVVAPAAVQTGIQSLIKRVTETPATPAQDVELEYWLVVGWPGEAERPAELGPIGAALDTIVAVAGPTQFRVEERIHLRSGVEQNGEAASPHTHVEQYARLAPDGAILADVNVRSDNNSRLHTRVSLAPGQLLVLGQAGWEGDPIVSRNHNTLTTDPSRETLYYVVRGHVRDAVAPR